MSIRDVLFPMFSYPVPTATGSIESAERLAAGLGAHIVGLTFELNIQSPVGLYADPVNVGGLLAAERRKSAANARDLIAAFDDPCARQGAWLAERHGCPSDLAPRSPRRRWAERTASSRR